MKFIKTVFILLLLQLTACENPVKQAVKELEYSGYEAFGVEKRDLLKKRISETRDDEDKAAKSLGDALDKMRKSYNLPESELSRHYEITKAAYNDANSRATEVHTSRTRMETVANDLFKEWRGEISEIHSADLKASSQTKLTASKAQFAELNSKLLAAEQKMAPVLQELKDRTLFLKHNLNAESIGHLKSESGRLDSEIVALIKDMKAAIAQADKFLASVK